jgi:putative tryptophan/tyrosine transport system substrate-binding protein
MQRREFITLLGGAAAAPILSSALGAQQAPGRPLIGILVPLSAATAARNIEALRAGLREFGYVEGRNVWFEFRYADGVPARLPALAAELVALKPAVIIAGSPPGIVAAQRATQTIPLIMFTTQDPVALGLVQSIARPGGNVTGLSMFGENALVGKRLELLKEVVPALERVGVMVNPGDPGDVTVLTLLPTAARSLGVTLKNYEARSTSDLDTAVSRALADGMQALFVNQNPFFLNRRAEVAALATRARLPAIYGYREFADAGGMMSYGSSLPAAYRQAARLVDKILKGADPAELPVEQAAKFELVVNLKTAKALGLKIPESFLLRADEVIE